MVKIRFFSEDWARLYFNFKIYYLQGIKITNFTELNFKVTWKFEEKYNLTKYIFWRNTHDKKYHFTKWTILLLKKFLSYCILLQLYLIELTIRQINRSLHSISSNCLQSDYLSKKSPQNWIRILFYLQEQFIF